jgi:hypothetical protein
MISSRQWRKNWTPIIVGYNVNRFDLLNDMWALYDWCQRYPQKLVEIPTDLMEAVLRHRILNESQFATLLGRTRQAINPWLKQREFDQYVQTPISMGKFDPHQIIYLIHIITSLAAELGPETYAVGLLAKCGDPGIISILTGVPINTIRRAEKGLPV